MRCFWNLPKFNCVGSQDVTMLFDFINKVDGKLNELCTGVRSTLSRSFMKETQWRTTYKYTIIALAYTTRWAISSAIASRTEFSASRAGANWSGTSWHRSKHAELLPLKNVSIPAMCYVRCAVRVGLHLHQSDCGGCRKRHLSSDCQKFNFHGCVWCVAIDFEAYIGNWIGRLTEWDQFFVMLFMHLIESI